MGRVAWNFANHLGDAPATGKPFVLHGLRHMPFHYCSPTGSLNFIMDLRAVGRVLMHLKTCILYIPFKTRQLLNL